jgi:hypothetical protein
MSRITSTRLKRLQIIERKFIDARGDMKYKAKVIGVDPPAPRRTVYPPTQSFTGKGILGVGAEGMPLGIKVSEGQHINWYKYQKRRARKDKQLNKIK